MRAAKTATTAAGLVLAGMVLTGCITVDNGPVAPPRADVPSPRPSKTTSNAPAKDQWTGTAVEPTRSPTQAIGMVDLNPDHGTSYVLANRPAGLMAPPKVLGPWITQWVVDGDQVTYREVICTGTAVREATGTLEDAEDGGGKAVRWIDNGEGEKDDPWTGNARSETSNATVTPTSMQVGLLDAATTDVAATKTTFAGYCRDAGEDVAGVFK